MQIIELTPEQRRVIEAGHDGPVPVVDPATQQRYVLIAQEHFERVQRLLELPLPAAHEPSPKIAPLMLQSMRAYWRELPRLRGLGSRSRRWVAYHADEQVGFGRTQAEVYQACFRRGLRRGEFYVGFLDADPEGVPPWGTLQGDRSAYESENAGEPSPEVR
jgi:hypothetical protein